MATNGSFDLPSSPPCPDQVFTRAALIALRDSGGLRPECHYRSVGPTIGTAGNTSATTIEQHAVSANVLSEEAKVFTSFNAVLGWEGSYDIDAGTAGTIYRLRDEWNNLAEDEDPNAPTVHTQVPWHRGGPDFGGNNFDTASLPGWATAVGTLTDNDIAGSTVNLTGMTTFVTGQFRRNRISNGSTVTVVSDQTTFIQNTIRNSFVNCQSGTQFGFLNNDLQAASLVTVDAATTGHVAISDNVMDNSYRLSVLGYVNTTPASLGSISGNRMVGKATGVDDLRISGPAEVRVYANDLLGGSLFINGSGTTFIDNCTLNNLNVVKDTASSGPLEIMSTQMADTSMTIGAANAGSTNSFTGCEVRNGSFTFNGPTLGGALNAFIGVDMNNLIMTVAATATAGIAINNGRYNGGTITQNRTAGDSSLHLLDCSMLGIGCSVTDNGTSDPSDPVAVYSSELIDSDIVFGDMGVRNPQPAPAVERVSLTASLISVSGLAASTAISRGRMLGANLNNAGFAVDLFTLDGLNKTMGANQAQRAGSVAFDNWT